MIEIRRPISSAVAAKPHRPVYRMHRYFARRPYTVFRHLIEHYTEPGDLVLDPFCGGGVTLVEGLILGRRVAGFDANPLATFITDMQLRDVNVDELSEVLVDASNSVGLVCSELFGTTCRDCGADTTAAWVEHSARAQCEHCAATFLIADAEKASTGRWRCPTCAESVRFSCEAETEFAALRVYYTCASCGHAAIDATTEADVRLVAIASNTLAQREADGLWVPTAAIPACNMERESALHKKRFTQFRQLFTDRHLLALALMNEVLEGVSGPLRDWLFFTFSSSLRYTNRMVTRNESWRGTRPLEWAKPGYWLPPVHLEANPAIEFKRRADAVLRGKRDYFKHIPTRAHATKVGIQALLQPKQPQFHIETRSSTSLPFPDNSVDCIITDPPYGSYVHYADLSNFWAIWLRGVQGLGDVIGTEEEAVIARKPFPGAKTSADYQSILTQCFCECARVLKHDRFLVMTFNNREPRAWIAVISAALHAGFTLPADGVIFQHGVPSYRHTAQSRRNGSVIGDFVFSFRLCGAAHSDPIETPPEELTEEFFLNIAEATLLEQGPCTPNELMTAMYLRAQPAMVASIRAAIKNGTDIERLVEHADSLMLFDSHRKHLLEEHFDYIDGKWFHRSCNEQSLAIS